MQHQFSDQMFHYTRYIMKKRVTSLRGPFPHHCARATQPLQNVAAVGTVGNTVCD